MDKEIRKSNEMIRATKTTAISVDAQKIFALILTKIEDSPSGIIRLYRHELNSLGEEFRKRWKNLDDNGHPVEMQQKFEELSSIKIHSIRWSSVLISTVTYGDNLEYVDYQIPDMLLPQLVNLKKHYTKYYLDMVLGFTGTKYTLSLYEILRSYLHQGQQEYTVTVHVESIKKQLAATSISYKSFKHFRQAVLLPAIKEINNNDVSDIRVSMRTDGRRPIQELTFSIFSLEQFQQQLKFDSALSNIPSSIKNICNEMGYSLYGKSLTFIQEAIGVYEEDLVLKALNKVCEWSDSRFRAKMVKRLLPGYLQALRVGEQEAEKLATAGMEKVMAGNFLEEQQKLKEQARRSKFDLWRNENAVAYQGLIKSVMNNIKGLPEPIAIKLVYNEWIDPESPPRPM